MSDKAHELALSFESQNLNEAFDGVCVHELELTEGISEPFRLEADLLLAKPLSKATIHSVLGARSRFTIRNKRLTDGGTAYYAERYVCGVVTRFRYEGIIYAAPHDLQRQHCARYKLTLEPKLAALADTRNTRSFSGKTPPEVILAILHDYGFDSNVNKSLLTADSWDKNQYFQQQEQSDWAFIARLMLLYGLNFNFIHSSEYWEPMFCLTNNWVFEPKKQVKTASGDTEVTVSDKVHYSDSNLQPFEDQYRYDRVRLNAGLRGQTEGVNVVLQNWNMEESCGLQAVTAGVADSDSLKDENGNRKLAWSLAGALNQYESKYGSLPYQKDRKRISENLLAAQKLKECRWSGTTDSLSASPGTRLDVLDFFGFAGENEKLEALVTRTKLYMRDVWPNDLAFPPGADLRPRPLRIEIQAVECDPQSQFCGSFVTQPEQRTPRRALPFVQNKASFFVGYVVASGNKAEDAFKTAADLTAGEYATAVQVLLEGVETPVYAEVSLSAGSRGSGMRYFPRNGDKVLVAGFGGRWFIVSYLPSSPLADAPSEMAALAMQTDSWRQGEVTDSTGLWNNRSANRIAMNQAVSARHYVLNLILTGKLEQFFKNYAITVANQDYYHVTTDSSIYQAYQQIKNTGLPAGAADTRKTAYVGKSLNDTVNGYLSALEAVQKAQLEQDRNVDSSELRSKLQDEAKSKLDDAWSSLVVIADCIAKTYMKGYTEDKPLMALQSAGNMLLSAGESGNMSLSGADVTVDGNKINITAQKQIVLTSAAGIQMKVGGNIFLMDTNGITMKSVRKMTGNGPFSSLVKLDSFSGVTISGISCAMNGTLRSGIADAFGGSVTASSGSVSVSGLEINETAGTVQSVMINFINFVADITTQLTTLNSNNKVNADTAMAMIDYLFKYNTASDILYALSNQYEETRHTDNWSFATAVKLFNQTLTMVQMSIDLALALCVADSSPFLTKDCKNGFNGKDVLTLTSTVMKMTVTIDTIMTMLILGAKNGMKTKSSMSIRTGDIQMDSTKVQILGKTIDQVISIGAGR